ncbi:MAG TPA: hypothetical protein VMY37_15275 [Thermoguttaceae bacterium]|nr:hypothetical protein [Thermoguttaceae bacterium]
MGEFMPVEHLNLCQQRYHVHIAPSEPTRSSPTEQRSETGRQIHDASNTPSGNVPGTDCVRATYWQSAVMRSVLTAICCLALLSCAAREERRCYGQCAITVECGDAEPRAVWAHVRHVLEEQSIKYTGRAQLMDGTPAGTFFEREGEVEVAVSPPRKGTIWINFFWLHPSIEAFGEEVRHIQEELAERCPDRVRLAEEISTGPW